MAHNGGPRIISDPNNPGRTIVVAAPPLLPIQVEVFLEGSHPFFGIVGTVPKILIKRFSIVAQNQLNQEGMFTSDPAKAITVLRLSFNRKRRPSPAAVNTIIEWFHANPKSTHDGTVTDLQANIDGDHMTALDWLCFAATGKSKLVARVEVLAAAVAFDLVRQPFALQRLIVDDLEERPVTAGEFKAVWEYLPSGHVVVEAMLDMTERFRNEGLVSEAENLAIEEYIWEDAVLRARFFPGSCRERNKTRRICNWA